MSKDSRKIKCLGNSVDTNEYYLHPITLNLGKNVAPHKICPSNIYYKNGKIRLTVADNNTSLTDKDIKSFMALPYLNLDIEQMLSFYKIENIDNIIKWINNMIDIDKPFNYINRILNIWIKQNFDELKSMKDYKILLTIYNKLKNKYYPDIKINEDKIKIWFKNKNIEDFHFNLAEELF
jgi:hypothetical protein